MIAPDSSVVIAALVSWHADHEAAREAIRPVDRRLVAHVAFETTSALSRMPQGQRVDPAIVTAALAATFTQPWLALDGAASAAALSTAVAASIRGGALYDALIALTVGHHGGLLVSADRRARRTYDALGVEVRFLGTG